MSITFQTRIDWPNNPLLLPPELFGIHVPAGVGSFHVRAPKFVGVSEMARLAPPRLSGRIALTNGLVTQRLSARFRDPARQWRRTSPPAGAPQHGPCQFQFTGGEVNLDLMLEIYILNMVDPDPADDLSVQIFALVYEHELLHVLDALDALRLWLPGELNRDSAILRYLEQRQPFSYGTVRRSVPDIEQEFRSRVADLVLGRADGIWAAEADRRASLRDSPAQYRLVEERIQALRIRQTNRPDRAARRPATPVR